MQFNISHLRRMGPVAALLAMVLVWAGCGDNAAVPSAQYTYDNPPPILHAPGAEGVLSSADWTLVIDGYVTGNGGMLSGGRYELEFFQGAVSGQTHITVYENSPTFMELELGPHGIQFSSTVYLYCDYSGTNADPDSPNYDGSVPAFFYYNDDAGVWEQQPGTNLTQEKKYRVLMSHFSRYAVGGIPGTGDW